MPLQVDCSVAIAALPTGSRFVHQSVLNVELGRIERNGEDPSRGLPLLNYFEVAAPGLIYGYDRRAFGGGYQRYNSSYQPTDFGRYWKFSVLRYGTELEHYAIA